VISPPSINRVPQGLLGFLGIKNGGQYPSALSNTLAPTFDLGECYANTNREYQTASIAVNALGQTNFHTAPIGQYWWVQHASLFTATIGAGAAYAGVLCMIDASGLVTTMLSTVTPAAGPGAVYTSQARDFWLLPGESLGVYTTGLTLGPINTGVSLSFARFLG